MAPSEYEDSSEEEPLSSDNKDHNDLNTANGDDANLHSDSDSGSDMFGSDDDDDDKGNNDEPEAGHDIEPFTTKDAPSEDEDFSNDEIDFTQVTTGKQASSTPSERGSLLTEAEALHQLIELLEPAETPLEALTRCAADTETVIKLTECCNVLLLSFDVYDALKEELLRRYSRETGKEFRGTKRRLETDTDDDQWYFRWIGDDEVHGPYSRDQMVEWKYHHFENQVEVRHMTLGDFIPITEATEL